MIKKKISLSDVDNFYNPDFLVKRISVNYNFPLDFSEGLVKEVKRMLFLAVISGEKIAPSNRIDCAWHEMILFTKFYKDFSELIGDFIHHNPFESEKKDEIINYEKIKKNFGKKVEGTETYNKTKENYEKFFGEKPDFKYWP